MKAPVKSKTTTKPKMDRREMIALIVMIVLVVTIAAVWLISSSQNGNSQVLGISMP
jgi:hypothetical protein